ncbi:Ribosomal protein L25/L23 [Denitrovibrio acetiphilus DSM 12809]|uniref:Large ribosomal subunit protein uL23 n=1 Tax=Denitrovibrio acetiphilus (strain DSM 12809 / NBRC 114555 / N2460) TaxID=522772 RepID=D4H390_DENA2|nr:50S ribosomal protein L23 [Denitrovibrio acetiphilus]ADD67174.1 Ribosomal protein L25/L23 [Denitrovibrio acetiphilus DSM 12809]
MITIYDVIKKPIITEKAVEAKETLNQVTFAVDPRATKLQIKQAVQKLFDVKVKDVRTMNTKGKEKRFGRTTGKRNDTKKAIVVLADGETLEFV